MLSLRENVLETLKNGKPDAFVNEWEPFPQVWEPITYYMLPVQQGGPPAKDPWGTTLIWGNNEPGAMPLISDDTKVCPDVTKWEKYCKAPDIENAPMDWSQAQADAKKIRDEGKFVMVWLFRGLFEQSHFLMGFEDTLMNFYDEPEAMKDLIAYIADFKKRQIRMLVDNLHPDVIMFHDDWGSKTSMFMSPDQWREFFKEPYREIYGMLKKETLITMHHADSFLQPIVTDLVELGIDIWQGALYTNDIQKIKKETNHKLTIMGGIDSKIDRKDASEEEIRAEIARVCRDYHEGGCFIPCLTYGGEGSIFPHVNDIIMDEVRKQSKIYFK